MIHYLQSILVGDWTKWIGFLLMAFINLQFFQALRTSVTTMTCSDETINGDMYSYFACVIVHFFAVCCCWMKVQMMTRGGEG